jgi:hypothetical protein
MLKLDASTLISSLPAIMGYQVYDSIVAVMLKRHGAQDAIDCVLRADLNNTVEQIATMPQVAGRSAKNTSGAILIAVAGAEHSRHAGDALDAVRNSLMDLDIPVRGRLSTATTAEPALWTDVDTGDSGITAPWTDSPVTTASVVEGRVVANTRDELVGEFALAEPAAPEVQTDNLEPLIAAGEELAAIIAGDGELTPDLVGRLALAITVSVRLRDAHLLLGLDHVQRTATVWTSMSRTMRGIARAQAATIAACYHYMGGDGPRAGIGVDVAIQAARDAGQEPLTLTKLLDTALHMGVPPQKIRDVILTAGTTGIGGA